MALIEPRCLPTLANNFYCKTLTVICCPFGYQQPMVDVKRHGPETCVQKIHICSTHLNLQNRRKKTKMLHAGVPNADFKLRGMESIEPIIERKTAIDQHTPLLDPFEAPRQNSHPTKAPVLHWAPFAILEGSIEAILLLRPIRHGYRSPIVSHNDIQFGFSSETQLLVPSLLTLIEPLLHRHA